MFNLYDRLFGKYEDEEFEEFSDLDEFEEPSRHIDVVNPEPEVSTPRFFERFTQKSSKADDKDHARVLDIHSGQEVNYRQEVVVMVPYNFEVTKLVCDYIKNGKTVICNIEKIDNETAQRVLDFILGATYSLGGSLESVSSKIFVVTPASTRLSMRLEQKEDKRYGRRSAYSNLRTAEVGTRRERKFETEGLSRFASRDNSLANERGPRAANQ